MPTKFSVAAFKRPGGQLIYVIALLAGLLTSSIFADEAQEALTELRARMAELQANLDDELRAKDQVMGELADVERQISEVKRSIARVVSSSAELEEDIQQLMMQQGAAQITTEKLLGQFSQLLIRGYPINREASLKLLLSASKPQTLARQWAYHQRLTQSSAETLAQIAHQIQTMRSNEITLREQHADLFELKKRQEESLSHLSVLAKERDNQLKIIDQRIAGNLGSLESLKADEAQLLEILETAQRELRALPVIEDSLPLLQRKGQLPMPVTGSVTYGFGQSRSAGESWRGWMIATKEEAPVHAIGAGRVVYANWLRGYGLLIIIDHQDEILSLYAHNATILFDVGDWVRSGELIALAGEPVGTGSSIQHGSYFELRRGGRPEDPAVWIDRSRLP